MGAIGMLSTHLKILRSIKLALSAHSLLAMTAVEPCICIQLGIIVPQKPHFVTLLLD